MRDGNHRLDPPHNEKATPHDPPSIQWIANVMRDPDTEESEAHFHQGPDSTPAVCYDPHCGSPHLDVNSE